MSVLCLKVLVLQGVMLSGFTASVELSSLQGFGLDRLLSWGACWQGNPKKKRH